MDKFPLITVITVSYNAVSTIEQTILSVINQTYPNIEYIIIDGGSTDGTVDVIRKYEDKVAYWVSEPDRGIYDAMNKGIAIATGEWINFMNAGDSFFSKTILEEISMRIEDASCIIYGDFIVDTQVGLYKKKPYPLTQMKKCMVLCHQASFIKTSYHKNHLFDTSFYSSGDYHFFYSAYYKTGCIFQYVPLTIACFDGKSGMSKDNFSTARKEDLRIYGKENDYYCLLKYYILVLIAFFKTIIKKKARRKLVEKMMVKNLRKAGFIVMEK